LAKTDEENRLVSGYATLDNVDTQGDVVTIESSKRAFAKTRARIREMHQPIAVGRIVDFKEDEFYDPKTNQFYRGIFVTAYVSKGAEDTWQKVLDGTLSAFSIGGAIIDSHTKIVKDAGVEKPVRFITEWELTELSLVDNPGNQFANIMSIQKSNDGSQLVKGMIADVKTENIFWCEEDGIAKTSPEESMSCNNCSGEMEAIGWCEEADRTEKIRQAIAQLSARNGGVDMEKAEETVETEVVEKAAEVEETEVVEKAADVEEVAVEESAENAEEETEEPKEADAEEAEEVEEEAEESEEVEKSAEVEETDANADLQKAIEALTESISKGLSEHAAEVLAKLDEVAKSFKDEVEEVRKSNQALEAKFEAVSEEVETVEKRVDGVVASTAGKKSGDLGGSPEKIEKRKQDDLWSGTFL